MSVEKIHSLKELLKQSPTPGAVRELVALLQNTPEQRAEAREILFQRINEDARDLHARLQLAKLFYLDKFTEFAVRELLEIRRRGETPALQRLIESFGPIAQEYSHAAPMQRDMGEVSESIVGELDIDFDEAEDEIS